MAGKRDSSSMKPPSYELEMKASDERKRLQGSLHELKLRMHDALDLKKAAREHIVSSCGTAAALAALAGYTVAALFGSR
jgi:hypothetical protein